MKESQFCTKLVNSFKAAGHWAYKIPDAPIFKGMQTTFNRERPFDIILMVGETGVAIECKMIKKRALDRREFLNLFTESQIKHMSEIQRKGGQCFAFLCYHKHAYAMEDRAHQVFIVPWHFVVGSAIPIGVDKPLTYSKGLYNIDNFIKHVKLGTDAGI